MAQFIRLQISLQGLFHDYFMAFLAGRVLSWTIVSRRSQLEAARTAPNFA